MPSKLPDQLQETGSATGKIDRDERYMNDSGKIIIRGAREHNLKNINVDIPRNKLVVITGLSGSGKSSLAFDTIFAEGQRRYVESLSAYARQFLEQMEKPDVDSIEGLSPAVSIEQKTVSKNPRSTVGTVTEIYDYLRVLYARIGRPYCYQCGRPIVAQTVQEMVDRIMELPEGAKVIVLSPVVTSRKGEYRKLFENLQKEGFVRVRVDGRIQELGQPISLDKNRKHTIEVVVDRLVIQSKMKNRLTDSVELALKLSDGQMQAWIDQTEELFFSEHASCHECGISYPELTPQMFSFNNPLGACPKCGGMGIRAELDASLIVPDPSKTIRQGAIAPWSNRYPGFFQQKLASLAHHYGFSPDIPFKELPSEVQRMLLHGSEGESITFHLKAGGGRYSWQGSFEGILGMLKRRYQETESLYVRQEIERYMAIGPCPECNGARLKRESLSVRVGGYSIHEITCFSVEKALEVFKNLQLTPQEREIARRIMKEIDERLNFLMNVGLNYLTLNRSSTTLSGGEGQRIRLATQIGSRLSGVLYVLDEPSIGLHQRDNRRLLDSLKSMRDLGNTILVVEHDAETILSADHVLDMGPGAGLGGGEVVFAGSPAKLLKSSASLTGKYLSGREKIPVPAQRRSSNNGHLVLKGAQENNLQNLTINIPLGTFICVTGVSGSGKSSLVNATLYRALAQKLYRSREPAGKLDALYGIEYIDKVINIDQSPIGRTPRSNPATYTGLFAPVRELFAGVPESRMRGYKPGRFSFNVKGGRCESCQGDGIIKIEMHFLPDVFVTCDVCKGKRYNRETLEIKYKGMNIAQVLEMTVEQAADFFVNVPIVMAKLKTLQDVGMGYVKLGQPATTLSGGEAQRVKLSRELSKRSTGRTIYILDEPTTGLHFDDIKKLLQVLNQLVDRGNTVVVIEHNLDVIKTADCIIDLGPEGGDNGGRIVAQGTPEEITRSENSYTGAYLRRVLPSQDDVKW
jgi:excinuclease ABC subunit A